MNADIVVLAASAGLQTATGGGIAITRDYRTSVPGIWAIGDAATFDGVRLGLLVAAASAAGGYFTGDNFTATRGQIRPNPGASSGRI
ncbi:FAD-dependent oxidoreductase [Arthrobacter sp. UYCo732]|uniref:FAD-dependent oxidoreductase n=1 Tax=Arthrobacter sp. UYCo732 TaxID=3156336 RepID=UPI003399EEB0